ncbi:long-chain fatty acid transporter-like protein [Byssothecium circinans]|uniref:Very long-chain fatty acid transport protein n=1 Tax=Byssothecium circinans TaxID=147558 RepID=A0A6A5TGD5_9PLEO|nr:long-chain fatty acid transporter-like protein [Byssothecium circinans]
MQALPYTLPAALAGLAYLDGRYSFTHDLPLFSSLLRSRISIFLHERNDDINLFYVLEQYAKSSTNRSRTFLIYKGETWSYAEAYENVLKYGTWLKSKGVQKDEVVAMDLINSDVFIWVWFGLWSIGAKPAFINYNMTGAPLVHMLRTSTARLVLVDEHSRENFREEVLAEHGLAPTEDGTRVAPDGRQATYGFDSNPNLIPASVQRQANLTSNSSPAAQGKEKEPQRQFLEIIFFDKRLENHILSLRPIRQPDSERGGQVRESMAMLIFTSGTTGLPKAAIMSWGKANIAGRFVHRWMPVKNTDIMYTAMPLYHASASVLGLGVMLRAGGATSLSQSFSHKTFWPEVKASKATIIQYVGETCRYLLAAPPSPLDKDHHVRTVFGNGLRPDIWKPFKERFGIEKICEFYSATEAPAGLFNKSINDFSAGAFARNGTLVTSLVGSTVHIVRVDQSNNSEPLRHPTTHLCYAAATDEPGELLFKLDAANIQQKFQGYFGNAKATNGKIIRDVKTKGDAYFRSGDLVRLDSEGRWFFVDRMGDTFRWKAENVSTAEVADVLGKCPTVEEACVYGVEVPHHDGRAGCAAIVLANKSTTPDEKTLGQIKDVLDKELPVFARPVFLRFTREMPKTGTNKQQKHVFQKAGIEVREVEREGDTMFWRVGKEGVYRRFGARELERVTGGSVKL